MTQTRILNSSQLVHDFGTSLFPFDGKRTTRLALQGESDYKTKIVASTAVRSLTFLDALSSKVFGRERKWVKVTLSHTVPTSVLERLIFVCRKIAHFICTRKWENIVYTPKKQTILLNVNSLCKRTNLSKKEVLESSPDELSARLADPSSIVWNYSKLSNKLFPHILLINMRTRADRIEGLENHFKTIGADLKYERVAAVIGANLPAETIAKMSKSDAAKQDEKRGLVRRLIEKATGNVKPARDDRKGRIGCFMSHLNAIKEAKAKGFSEVLILEDDVRFIPNYFSSNYANRARAELPNNWGMLFLGHFDAKKKESKPFSDHLVKPGCPYDCHAYVVNASMYDSLINALENELQKSHGEMRALDVVIGEDLVKTGKIFACKENIAIQDEGISSIVEMNIAGNYKRELRRFHSTLSPKAEPGKTRDGLPVMQKMLAGTLYQMMHHIGKLFEKHGIGYVVESGTALGVERHKGLIPHDDDIDLQLFPGEEKKLADLTLRAELKQVGLEIVDHWLGAKICPIKDHPLGQTLHIDGYRFKSPSVDLFFSEEEMRDGEPVHFYKSERAKGYWPKLYMKKSEIFQADGTVPMGSFGPVKVRTMAKQKEYCLRGYGSDCLGEAYLQYDHLRERGLTKRPIAISDFAPPPYEEWDGIQSCLTPTKV